MEKQTEYLRQQNKSQQGETQKHKTDARDLERKGK